MAEYKALAQNTVKITTEMVLHHNIDLGAPLVHNHPRIKHISSDNSRVSYFNLTPSSITSSTSSTGIAAINHEGEALSTNTIDYNYPLFKSYKSYFIPLETVSVVVDGKKYVGQKSAAYLALYKHNYCTQNNSITLPSDGYCPAARVKAVIYSASTRTIMTTECDFPVTTFPALSSSGRNEPAYHYYGTVARLVFFRLKKETNDVVLAIEIEYPKYDITIVGNNTGLQYSLDDGLTFQDVTAELALEQIEHVVFKNTGDITKKVGTTEGGTDIATIAAGATYVAVPTANGTWYIS